MTIIPPIPPYTLPSRPLTQIQPFTTRAGVTYALKLEELQFYVTETLVAYITENFAGLGDEFETEVNRLLTEVAAALEALNISVDERISEMDSRLETAISESDSRLTTAIADLTLYVNTKVQEIIDGSIEVADAVTADIFLNDDSDTREVVDALYAGLDVFNDLLETVQGLGSTYASKETQTVVESGRLSEPSLNNSYANKETQTLVESGRLTETSLDAAYSSKSVQTMVETGRLTVDALDNQITETIKSTQKILGWAPTLNNLVIGTDGLFTALFWYDGHQIFGEIDIKFGTAPSFGVNPTISLPSKVKLRNAYVRPIGQADLWDVSASTIIKLDALNAEVSGTLLSLSRTETGGYGGLVNGAAGLPGAVAVNDTLNIKFAYVPDVAPDIRTFGAIGDSITAWESWNQPFATAQPWVNYVASGDLKFAGGYAHGSYTTAQILAMMTDRIYADVAVAVVGTNDPYFSVPPATTLANVVSIAAKADVENFILCAVPPYNANPSVMTALNNSFATLASTNGWIFVDPWAAFRATGNVWTAGASSDGTHPTTTVQQAAAAVIRAAINAI